MQKKPDFSRKILKILSEKPVSSLSELSERIVPRTATKVPVYAINRSLKGLKEAGLVENLSSDRTKYTRLTNEGKKKANSLKLESDSAILDPKWDGKWRIILLDLPESRKNERDSLRYLLKKAGFVCLKNSAWISPYPFEHLFENIKKDLGFTTEIIILTTDTIDSTSEKYFFENFKK